MSKQRLDVLLVDQGYFLSREKAKRGIMAGEVFVDHQRVDKPGTLVDSQAQIMVKTKEKYVSRGGYKLEKALEYFGIDLKDKRCMDIGASTGGFTDCMLQNGAKIVYSIDVGYGQLDWALRNHPQVVSMERTNFRLLDTQTIEEAIDFFSVDVSFISLWHIFPNMAQLCHKNSELVTLIKPQFEAGRHQVGKKGVVKDPKVHEAVIDKVLSDGVINEFYIQDISFSPIKGPKGNIEYLAYFKRHNMNTPFDIKVKIKEIVSSAFSELNN